jgi:toxin CptA
VSGRVLRGSLVTPYLVTLNIALSERRGVRSILVLPDTMSVDSFRRLRVMLVWGKRDDKAAPV